MSILLILSIISLTFVGYDFNSRNISSNFNNIILSFCFSTSIIILFYNWSLYLHLSYLTVTFSYFITICFSLFYLKKHIKLNIKLIQINSFHILLAFILLIANILFWENTNKWGGWDAWSIWSHHAKHLTNESNWTYLFSKDNTWSHVDYPIYLPSLIAIIWNQTSMFSPLIPAIIAFIVYLFLIIFFYFSFNNLKGLTSLLICIFFLQKDFIQLASSQYSDTILSLFILIGIYLINILEKVELKFYMYIGFFLSIPIWIKNEGIVFFLISSIFIVVKIYNEKKKVIYYMLGTLPFIITYFYFKLGFAPSNDITGSIQFSTVDKILDFNRYILIIKRLTTTLIIQNPFLVIITFAIINIIKLKHFTHLFIIPASILTVYLFIYVVTPMDLNWHLNTSLNRLILQLVPAYLFCLLISIRNFLTKNDKFITFF